MYMMGYVYMIQLIVFNKYTHIGLPPEILVTKSNI